MPENPEILVAIQPALFHDLFSDEMQRRLHDLATLTFAVGDENLTSAQLEQHIPGYDIVITGWGTPEFTDEVRAAAAQLKLIAHSAGSIKLMLPPAVFEQGIRVSHVSAALAPPVGETTLLLIMLSLRQFHKIDRAFKHGGWQSARDFSPGIELAGQRIGIIGAGYAGREAMRRLGTLGVELWLYDPYLSADDAAAFGAQQVDLDRLLRECPIVSVHAPTTTETYRMIDAEQFALMQDGAIFINTARPHVIDETALLAELQSGRISAALDVFEQEPLPDHSPFRDLDNVIITPHIAAHTRQARWRQGRFATEEITSFLSDGTLRYEVSRAMLETMA